MSIHIVNDLPSTNELNERFPIGLEHHLEEYQRQMRAILDGTDTNRLAMIVGPCSAWSPDAVKEYSDRLAGLQEKVRERLFLVMRMYLTKPRTVHGWKGTMMQPDPLGQPDIREGICVSRDMMWHAGQRVPLADEMLYTRNAQQFDKLLTYTALGARSSEDQEHRQIASGLNTAVGVKNPTSGNIKKGVDAVEVAQSSHDLLLGGQHVRTDGNPYAHLILRGGENGSNYDPESIARASKLINDPNRTIQHPAIIIDASHDNCRNGDGKDPTLQCAVVDNVLWGITNQRQEYRNVRGFMIESFLEGGSQAIGPDMQHGKSITDPCLSWKDTEKLLRETADKLDSAL